MSELLDLPPELISHIFFLCEDLIYEDPEDAVPVSVVFALLFRLSNHYIENSTRHVFAASYFHTQSIKMSDNASMRRFCDIARFLELAKYVDELRFYAVNDRHERLEISSASRNEFVDALRACSAVDELVFFDGPSDHPNYMRREDRTEGALRAPTIGEVFDVSSTFSFVLSVAEEAGIRPKWIRTTSYNPKQLWQCGLADCSVIAVRKSVLREVEQLDIHLVPQRPEHGVTPEDMYVNT